MDFLMLGNHPFLDFVNTCPVVNGEPVELIGDGGAFLNLLGRLELPDRPSLRGVSAQEVAAAAEQARRLREDFRQLLKDVRGTVRRPNDLAAVNSWLERLGPPSFVLERDELKISHLAAGSVGQDQWLVPILRSACDLLTSPHLIRVRKCANPDCVLWYVDTTKSGTRRWCSMDICGNTMKARAFRERHRTEFSPDVID